MFSYQGGNSSSQGSALVEHQCIMGISTEKVLFDLLMACQWNAKVTAKNYVNSELRQLNIENKVRRYNKDYTFSANTWTAYMKANINKV